MQVILQAIVGSTAYGLNHAESDEDRLGVYVRPTRDTLRLNYQANKDTSTTLFETDSTHHELGKYLRLALKANPTVLELMYATSYEEETAVGKELVGMRGAFLSAYAVGSYGGYAFSHFDGIATESDHKRYKKRIRHCFRVLRQGRELLESGALTLKVEDPAEYFRLGEMPYEEVSQHFLRERTLFEEAATRSVLPELPDFDRVEAFLLRVRKENW